MKQLIYAVLLACFLRTPLAAAQERSRIQTQIVILDRFLDRSGVALQESVSNLEQIAGGLSDSEYRRVEPIIIAGIYADDLVARLSDPANIYAHMQDAHDQETVRIDLRGLAIYAVQQFNHQIKQVNLGEAYLRSPPAVAEAERILDAMQKIRDHTKAFVLTN